MQNNLNIKLNKTLAIFCTILAIPMIGLFVSVFSFFTFPIITAVMSVMLMVKMDARFSKSGYILTLIATVLHFVMVVLAVAASSDIATTITAFIMFISWLLYTIAAVLLWTTFKKIELASTGNAQHTPKKHFFNQNPQPIQSTEQIICPQCGAPNNSVALNNPVCQYCGSSLRK